MSFTLCHCAGNMFQPTAKRVAAYKIAAARGDVLTFTEVAKDHDAIQSLTGFRAATMVELAIAWKADKFDRVDSGGKLVLEGGKAGALGSKGDNRKRGPNRYALWVTLREKTTGQLWLIATHHGPAKPDTGEKWRQPLANLALKNFAAEIRRAQALHPGAELVVTGDFNRRRTVNLGLGLTELKTPGTLGSSRYDRVQTDPDVRTSGLEVIATGLDHKAVVVRLSVMGATPTPTPPEGTMPRTPSQALAWTEQPMSFEAGLCKMMCRTAYNVPSDGAKDATVAWGRAKHKHAGDRNPPRGALVWWTGGRSGHGHVAISLGDGRIRSTDLPKSGRWGSVPLGDPERLWGLKFVGWSEDIDGVRVMDAGVVPTPRPDLPKPTTPTTVARRMQPAAYKLGAKGTHVTWLGKRLVLHGYGRFYKNGPGPTFTATDKKAVAAFQRAQGWTGKDADGLPGEATLKLLAKAPKKPATTPTKPPATVKVKPVLADVSHHQGSLDLAKAKKAGLQGLYHKATEGETFTDDEYTARRKQAKAIGLPFGGYHFARPDVSKGDGRDECRFFLEHSKPVKGDLTGALDLEDRAGVTKFKIDRAELTVWVRDFVAEYKRQTGALPLLYNVFDLDDTFGCRIWVPRYNDAMKPPVVPKPWKAWDIWQYTNGVAGRPNSLAGLGHVDLNTFRAGFTVSDLIL